MHGTTVLCLFAVTIGLGGCGLLPTPLQKATRAGDVQTMRTLLADGADVHEMSYVRSFGRGHGDGVIVTSSLNLAAMTGNYEAAELLLEYGADPNQIVVSLVTPPEGLYYNFTGTAVMTAAIMDHPEIVELLLDHGADINAKTQEMSAIGNADRTPYQPGADSLFLAATAGSARVTRLLLTRGANPNTETAGVPAIMEAAHKERHEIVEQLLDHQAKVLPSDKLPGPTARMCHIAADYYQSSDPVQALDLYKLAAMYYPIGAKIFDDKAGAIELEGTVLIAAATALDPYQTGFSAYSRYKEASKAMRLRAAQYRADGEICESIVELKEKHPERSLSDCVEQVVGVLPNNQER